MSKLNAGILTIILGLACLAGLPGANALAVDTDYATASVTVLGVNSITVTAPTAPTLVVTLDSSVNQTLQFIATANITDGVSPRLVDITANATWESDNPSVATINSATGNATIYTVGRTTISAKYGGQTGNATLRVSGSSSSSGGGGGGGGGATGTTSMTEYVNSTGAFVIDAEAESADGIVKIEIPKGTVARNQNGQRLNFITIKEKEPPFEPADVKFVCPVYEIVPLGFTFDPAIYLTFKYRDFDIPAGYVEENLVIVTWQNEKWTELEDRIVDMVKNTITVPITHFSIFTVMAYTTPARLEVSGMTISPVEIYTGRPTTLSVTVTNTGALIGDFEVILRINNVKYETQKMTLGGEKSQAVSFTLTLNKAGAYTADINGLSTQFNVNKPPEGTVAEVKPTGPAEFTISGLTITPAEAKPAEEVTISAMVNNIGGSDGLYVVILKIDDKEQARKDVILKAGESETVTFPVTINMLGKYAIDVNGQKGEFTVKLAPPLSTDTVMPEKPSLNWRPMAIIFGCLVVVVFFLVIFYKKLR